MAGRPEGFAPRCAVVAGFGAVTAAFDGAAAVLDGVAEFLAAGAAPAPGVADRATARGEDDADDAVDGVDRVGDGDGTAEREGCAGMPIAGASACTPIRLLPMATARIAPITETGQPKPRSRRPRRPDWSTNTGAGADSPEAGSDHSGCVWCADPHWTEDMAVRTLRGLSLQGT
ncbi:hypothetical protein GCM10010215_34070 [Streptomyces virginiae]|uniref:Uncharacterized protein n=1 Tax=Streptomyces virginiae TaxID=1961 RepID=A0ABQ3NRD1_STRVG|nr:hypothetical protein ADK92_16625 [Streptomyces sp. XY533]KOV13391.1 hypothetical protein ADK91_08920 [Streptomyces sp. XY511]KOV37911.1 hypothetical protein ADK98_35900 [Streptomyces sp. H036]GGQ05859.1 hypothetical protein GCM10010215_34070 [Streptomyces virginiae]GLV92115.1 hypothetical protein Slala04_35690 [Streptomyces lavendulae subsp. lavendulae]